MNQDSTRASKPHVLICDDNPAVHESIQMYLQAANMEGTSIFDGRNLLNILEKKQFDVLILDIMMPSSNGMDLCRQIRKQSTIPIVFLSARGEEQDKVHGFEIGCDDYISKPFSPRELIARIKRIIKRQGKVIEQNHLLEVGKSQIDTEALILKTDASVIELSIKELEFLCLLARSPARVFSREQLLDRVWGYDFLGDIRAVDTLVKRLRKKIMSEKTGFDIRAVYGAGYKLEIE